MSLMTRRHAELEVDEPAIAGLAVAGGVVPAGRLWTSSERTAVLAADAVGLVLVLVGAFGAGGTRDLGSQVPWVTVATVGCGIAMIGHSVGYQLARGRIRAAARAIVLRRTAHPLPAARVVAIAGDVTLVAGAGMGLYHRANCPFVADKATRPAPRRDHEIAGRRPCAVCLP